MLRYRLRNVRKFALISESQKPVARKVLDTHQRDAVQALRNHDVRIASFNTRILVNRFLQAVFSENVQESVDLLKRVRSVETAKMQDFSVHRSCFITLLNHMIEMPEVSLASLRHVLKEYKKDASDAEVANLVVVLVLKVLSSVYGVRGQRISTLHLVSYAKETCADETGVLQVLNQRRLPLFREFNVVFGRNEEPVLPAGHSPERRFLRGRIQAIKGRSPFLDFGGLCDFIRYTTYDQYERHMQDTESRAEIDSCHASDERQKSFLYEKQLLIEEYSQAVHRNVAQSYQVSQFKEIHRQWIQKWQKKGISSVQDSAEIAKRHAVLHTHYPADYVVPMVLSHMLSATLSSPQAKVLTMAQKITHTLKSLVRNDKQLQKSHILNQALFSEPQLLEYTCCVIEILVRVVEMPETGFFAAGPVFEFGLIPTESRHKRYGALKINSNIASALKNYQILFQSGSFDLPMVHPPQAWTSPKKGGFLANPTSLVKFSDQNALAVYLSTAHATGQLSSVYQALNAMSSVAWAINPFILQTYNAVADQEEISRRLFKAPLNMAKIEMGTVPPRPRVSDSPDQKAYFAEYSAWKRHRQATVQAYNDAVNLCISYNMSKQLANAYAGQTFYLPHSLDFRGRVYPAVSFLSYQGDDLARGLMMFGEPRRLGQHGFRWLQYQLANVFSQSKMDMEQATRFVQDNRHNIQNSSANAADPKAWWLQADNPWQCLALCREVAEIWAFSGEIADYESHIPVHQDGSCNGLQHYSALGGDVEAAKSVNVLPVDQRQDVYTTVLEQVKRRIEQENDPNVELALSLLSRKLIKQTVMTTVYGVTQFGATEQICRQIASVLPENSHSHMKVAGYIAKHVLGSISELFAGAKEIQSWLVDNCHRCVQAFTKSEQKIDFFSTNRWRPMMWTSLSGLPVVQLYRKRESKKIQTSLQNLTLSDDAKMAPIDQVKSRNGIAPNFIHSIDAMHLKMTCLAANEKNITFVGVHDSYWTHASSVETLSTVLREEFVRLHGSDIIGNLRQDLMYLNRQSYQLVWAERKSAFGEALCALREAYGGTGSKTDIWNEQLNHEIEDNAAVEQLVQEHCPDLFFRVPGPRHAIVYSEEDSKSGQRISISSHVPLLVPVKILQPPKVGTLNVEEVLKSTHFFS